MDLTLTRIQEAKNEGAGSSVLAHLGGYHRALEDVLAMENE